METGRRQSNSQSLSLASWRETMRRDYLQSYVPAGGGAVKVVVASEAGRDAVRRALAEDAANEGFRYAHVDSAKRRVHLVHQFVWEVASQLPWDDIAKQVLMRALLEKHYTIPSSGDISVEALAEANDQTESEVVKEVRKLISSRVFQNYALSREFRTAATTLCRAAYDRDAEVQAEAKDVRAWLDGTLERISLLRRLGIFRKVVRANAREIFYSIAAWLAGSGEKGLVVTIDVSRYVLGKDAPPAAFAAYTKLAELDFSEVLRQFVDATDDLRGTLLVFLTDERFVKEERRGLRAYDALRLRLSDDVRDRDRPNPLAPMVLLEEPA